MDLKKAMEILKNTYEGIDIKGYWVDGYGKTLNIMDDMSKNHIKNTIKNLRIEEKRYMYCVEGSATNEALELIQSKIEELENALDRLI